MLLDRLVVRVLADDALAVLGAAVLRLQLLRLRTDPGEVVSPQFLGELAEVEARLLAAVAPVDALAHAEMVPPADTFPARPAHFDA